MANTHRRIDFTYILLSGSGIIFILAAIIVDFMQEENLFHAIP